MEELESLNLELSEENARIKNLVRSSSGPSAPHPSRMPNNSIPHPKSKVLPPPPPRPGSPTSRQGDQSSWTSRILHSVKETVFGDDEDGSGNGFDGPPNLPDKRRRQRASPNGESESSDESDSPRSRTHRSRMIAPNPHSVAYSANGPSPALRKSSGPTSGRGSHSGSGLMVITAEMREAGGKVFRSPSGVAKKATDNHVEKGK